MISVDGYEQAVKVIYLSRTPPRNRSQPNEICQWRVQDSGYERKMRGGGMKPELIGIPDTSFQRSRHVFKPKKGVYSGSYVGRQAEQ